MARIHPDQRRREIDAHRDASGIIGLRVRVVARDGELVAVPMSAQGSGVSTSMVQSNGLAIVETGVTSIEAGALVPAILFGNVVSD